MYAEDIITGIITTTIIGSLIIPIIIIIVYIILFICIVKSTIRLKEIEETIEKRLAKEELLLNAINSNTSETAKNLNTITDKRLYMIEGYLKEIAKNTRESK